MDPNAKSPKRGKCKQKCKQAGWLSGIDPIRTPDPPHQLIQVAARSSPPRLLLSRGMEHSRDRHQAWCLSLTRRPLVRAPGLGEYEGSWLQRRETCNTVGAVLGVETSWALGAGTTVWPDPCS